MKIEGAQNDSNFAHTLSRAFTGKLFNIKLNILLNILIICLVYNFQKVNTPYSKIGFYLVLLLFPLTCCCLVIFSFFSLLFLYFHKQSLHLILFSRTGTKFNTNEIIMKKNTECDSFVCDVEYQSLCCFLLVLYAQYDYHKCYK